jgi:hypothetical protein
LQGFGVFFWECGALMEENSRGLVLGEFGFWVWSFEGAKQMAF